MASREPFSRIRRGQHGAADDEWDIARAAEFAAESYGWGPDYIERLTDEQIVTYLDSATERLDGAASVRFEEAVEATRIGYIIARDRRSYQRWNSRPRRGAKRKGLTGMALESAVRNIAAMYPDNVIIGAANG